MPRISLEGFDIPPERRAELAERILEAAGSVAKEAGRAPDVVFADEPGGPAAANVAYSNLRDIYWGFAAARAMTTAAELDLFTCIARGHDTAEACARAAGCSERGTVRLLDVLVSIRLLTKSGDRYVCTPPVQQVLVKDSPNYSPGITHTERMWSAWFLMPEAVRKGSPASDISDERLAGEYFPDVSARLYKRHRPWAELVADRMVAEVQNRPLRIVDLGAGSAVWSISFAQRNQKTRVKAVDLPTVIYLAWEFADRARVTDQYEFVSQSYHEIRYGESNTDLFILGHICHTEGRERTRSLLRAIVPALTPEGKVLIAEVFANPGRDGPPYEMLFGLNWLVLSEAGDIFTVPEFTEMLHEVGLKRVEEIPIPGAWPLLAASR